MLDIFWPAKICIECTNGQIRMRRADKAEPGSRQRRRVRAFTGNVQSPRVQEGCQGHRDSMSLESSIGPPQPNLPPGALTLEPSTGWRATSSNDCRSCRVSDPLVQASRFDVPGSSELRSKGSGPRSWRSRGGYQVALKARNAKRGSHVSMRPPLFRRNRRYPVSFRFAAG